MSIPVTFEPLVRQLPPIKKKEYDNIINEMIKDCENTVKFSMAEIFSIEYITNKDIC